MSTKIYFAYRCSIKEFTQTFLPTFRETCFKNATREVKKLMQAVTEQELRAKYKEMTKYSSDWSYERWTKERNKCNRCQIVFEKAAEASQKLERNLFYCIDCSINVWFYNGKAYIIPYGESWLREGYKIEGVVEDYCFYNNTDRPDDVTSRQWLAREKTWDKVCLDNWDAGRLTHIIIDADKHVGLYEVAKPLVPASQLAESIYF